jgi:DNA-binding transcriptional ArsR family regulator
MAMIKTLETYEQLKAVSDPFRSQILMLLIEKPMTGQQLAEYFDLPRAKIHYHLKELQKHELVDLSYTEEKGGILQKFYRASASGFYPDPSLFPNTEEVSESNRQMLLRMAEKERRVILSAPSDAFVDQALSSASDYEEWPLVGHMSQMHLSEEDFIEWKKRYFALMEEFSERSNQTSRENASLYYFHSTAFEIDYPAFETDTKKDQKDN